MNFRAQPVRISTSEGGVLKVIGKGRNARVNFHTGKNTSYGLIENSPELRKFLCDALKRLHVEPFCMTCEDQRTVVRGTGDIEHPLRITACPDCLPKGTPLNQAILQRGNDERYVRTAFDIGTSDSCSSSSALESLP